MIMFHHASYMYLYMGFGTARKVKALQAGKIDVADLSGSNEQDAFQMLKGDPRVRIEPVATARATS